jgi:hypothetical protein
MGVEVKVRVEVRGVVRRARVMDVRYIFIDAVVLVKSEVLLQ